MTDRHPLTDEIIHREFLPKYCYTENDLRLVADWQLEQDAEWWKIILNRLKMIHPHVVDSIIEEFKQAMRPQRQQKQEDN